MKNLIWTVFLTVCTLFILWTGASYIEVITKNNNENPIYCEYNLFEILTENLAYPTP